MIPENILSHGDTMSPHYLGWRCACGLHNCPVHGALMLEKNAADSYELWIATVNDTTGAVTRERLADLPVLWLYASRQIRTTLWPSSTQVVLPTELMDHWLRLHYDIIRHTVRMEVAVKGNDRLRIFELENSAMRGALMTWSNAANDLLMRWQWYATWTLAQRVRNSPG